MMRTLFFAAALSISSLAIAQSTTTTTTTTPPAQDEAATTAEPSGETVDDPSQATGPEGITQQGTDPQGQATGPRPAAGDYPPCSKTVTDSCVQTYERGVRRSRRR
jgi:hypothetical protein